MTRNSLLWTVLALGAVACGAHPVRQESSGATVDSAAADDLDSLLGSALGRLRGATGRYDLEQAPGGLPVVWADDLSDRRGRPACSLTTVERYPGTGWSPLLIQLDPTPHFCSEALPSLLHELIHSLAPDAPHVEEPGWLFSDGVGRSTVLDEPSLLRLCEYFRCDAFSPESEPQ